MLTKKQKQRTKSYYLFNNIDDFQKNQLLNIKPLRRSRVVAYIQTSISERTWEMHEKALQK